MSVQANAVDTLLTWYNPLELPENKLMDEETIYNWTRDNVTEKKWPGIINYSWELSPTLAVYLPFRYIFLTHSRYVSAI